MTPENRRRNVAEEWAMSVAALQEADDNLGMGHYRVSVTRAYFAAFHAARAALLTRESEPLTHSGVRAMFHREFVHTGRLSREAGRVLGHLQQEREEADYSRIASFGRAEAEEAIDAARALRQAVESLLRSDGAFPD